MEIHLKFKSHLEKHPKTLESIGLYINISRSHLSRVLNGERPMLDSLRIKLNACLGTNFKFDEVDNP